MSGNRDGQMSPSRHIVTFDGSDDALALAGALRPLARALIELALQLTREQTNDQVTEEQTA